MTEHADFEALSAFVDGEAPEWAGHVEACPTCRASVDQLRAVAAAVRAPVDPPDPRVREAAIGAALGAALGPALPRPATERVPARQRRVNWQYALAAAAAVVFGVAGLATLLVSQNGSNDESTTVAGPALQSAPKAGNAESAERGSAADAAAPSVADLGDVPDAATLLARARPPAATAGAFSSPTTTLGGRATAPGAPVVTGTRPCEEQARTREPALGQVVYFATARRGSVPAYVLGFSTGPTGSPVTLLLLAQNGCGELLRAAGP
jgi:hypothetical protein